VEITKRFVCRNGKNINCDVVHNRSCQSNNYLFLIDRMRNCRSDIIDMNYNNFKAGDHVKIVHNCRNMNVSLCSAPDHMGKNGVIVSINTSLFPPIEISFGEGRNWFHNAICLKKFNPKSFNPEDIISKAFGGV